MTQSFFIIFVKNFCLGKDFMLFLKKPAFRTKSCYFRMNYSELFPKMDAVRAIINGHCKRDTSN